MPVMSDIRSLLMSVLRSLLLMFSNVSTLIAEAILARLGHRTLMHLLALGKEGGHNNCARSTQLFAAEVGFGHGALNGGSLLVAKGDGL